MQIMYAGAAVFCFVCGGTGRSGLGTAVFLSLFSSLLVLMRASSAAADAPARAHGGRRT
ncbi:hypothetical protein [Streptomyces sp. enrichment culture]|uniref:hypothetical protein n=1 Tax=Streptomyces sp. enrichment culture TaxID=1795815 RepID=UPI003F566DE2